MADNLTKKDIEELLQEQTANILDALDAGLTKARKEREELRQAIHELTNTLDAFLKKLTDYETEMEIFRKKMDKITAFIKEKFGVEITAQ